MKRILFILAACITLSVQAQQLSTIYKSGDIKLVPDRTYGQNNDWDKIFPDYKQTDHGRATGLYKQIVVAPDGSVFMSHRCRHSISLFDKNGNYVRDFGQKGKTKADFVYMPGVDGILDGKLLYTAAVDGRMHFFDLSGKWVKTVTLKYMPLGTIPLRGGKIAVMGHVPYGDRSRQIISLLDVTSGKEKIIHSYFEMYSDDKKKSIVINPYFYTDKEGKQQRIGNWITCSLPNNDPYFSRTRLATTTTGNLVTANPTTGEILIFDPSGKKLKQFRTDIQPDMITKEDRENYYQDALKNFKKLEADVAKMTEGKEYWENYVTQYRQQLEKFRDPANYPEHLPYFSEMLIDSENNILLFRFTRNQGSNKFDVFTYNNSGKKIASSSFSADDYELKINPSVFKFHKGYIYTYLRRKGENIGNPMRLVRFSLQTDKK